MKQFFVGIFDHISSNCNWITFAQIDKGDATFGACMLNVVWKLLKYCYFNILILFSYVRNEEEAATAVINRRLNMIFDHELCREVQKATTVPATSITAVNIIFPSEAKLRFFLLWCRAKRFYSWPSSKCTNRTEIVPEHLESAAA